MSFQVVFDEMTEDALLAVFVARGSSVSKCREGDGA